MPPNTKRARPAADDDSKARRRDDILSVAARIFAANGYPKTEMQTIADACGLAKGTLYLYFPEGKEQLFLAACDKGMRDLIAVTDACRESISDPLETIAAAIRAYLQFFHEHPEQVELLIQERAEFRDRKSSTYFEHREKRRSVWGALLLNLVSTGRFRDIPLSRIDNVFCDLVYGTMFTNHFTARRVPLDEQVADILDVAFFGLLSDAERQKFRPKEQRS
jgi:AcrR family transcriptional regulator